MKKLIIVATVAVLSCLPVCASAAKGNQLIPNGFAAYKDSGAKSAIEAWIKGSGIEGSKEALAQANMLDQISEYYGKYLGYEVLKKNSISKNTSVYLVVVNYEKGSVFANFFTYVKPDGAEVIQTFNFNTDANKVFPSSAIYGE